MTPPKFAVILAVLAAVSPAEPQEKALKVISATPRGEIASLPESQTIMVAFNQPMVALQGVPEEQSTGPLRVEPQITGIYRWMGTSTLTFETARPLPYATRFSITVPAGIQALSGATLRNDLKFQFETPRPRLLSSSPSDGQGWVELDHNVYLRFNQPMLPEQARDHIVLRDLRSGANVPYRIRFATREELEPETLRRRRTYGRRTGRIDLGEDPRAVLVLEPLRHLSKGSPHQVVIDGEIQGAEGPLPAARQSTIRFETYEEFRFEGLRDVDVELADGNRIDLGGRQDPTRPLNFKFSNPVSPSRLVGALSIEPSVAIPGYYSTYDYARTGISIMLELLPDTVYTVTLADSLKDVFDNPLGKEIVFTFGTSDYPPTLRMSPGVGIVEAYEPHRYPIVLVNIDSVHLQMTRLEADQVVPLFAVSKEGKRWEDPFDIREPAPLHFDVDRWWQPALTRNRRVRFPIQLDEALGERDTGIVFVQARSPDPASSKSFWYKSLLQVTRLGVTVKTSPTNSLVWVTRLQDGSAVEGAMVEVRDDSNRVRWSGTTDESGRATTPGWGALGIPARERWGQPRQWFVVRKQGDVTLTSSEWGTGIAPYRFGIPYDWNPQPTELSATLFTERGIYRAGESAYVKGILRRKRGAGEWEIPTNFRFRVHVRDSQNEEIFSDSLIVDEWGGFDVSIPLAETAHLGWYRVEAETTVTVHGRPQANTFATTSFRVEAYRPAEFQVTVRTAKDEYIFGDSLKATISGRYLFGSAMHDAPVAWRMRFNPAHFRPPGRKDYYFGPLGSWGPTGSRPTSRLLDSREGHLDHSGEITVDVLLAADDYRQSANLMIEGTVTGPSRQSISGRKTVTVHRGEFYLGLKPSTTFTEEEKPLTFLLAAVTPDGKAVPDQTVEIAVIRRQWHSVRKAGVGGRYEWISEQQDTVVDSVTLVSAVEPISHTYTPPSAGLFFIRAEARDERGNPLLTECYFYVTGKGYVAWARREDDFVDLVADAEEYHPGETARILVKSPFEHATALITLEREDVLASFVRQLEGTAVNLEIPIEAEHLPNVFVSVVLIQGRVAENAGSDVGEDVGRPQFRIGYINLPVDAGNKRLDVSVATEQSSYRPGDSVKVELGVQNPGGNGVSAQLAVAVVDAGVLNLINYRLPDPFQSFYGPRPLSVVNAATLLHLVEQRNYGEKGESEGGGGAEAPSGLMGVELRGDFRATAYWNPAVVTDENGRAQVTFELPDNLTTWVVMVVAQSRSSEFGRGETSFVVNKPLLLQAALPRFARLGDAFEAGVVVHNYTEADGQVSVTATANGIEMEGEPSVDLKLSPGEAREARFAFEAVQVDDAAFQFRAVMKQDNGRTETDGLEVTIPVQVPRRKEATATYGETEGEAEETVTVPGDIYPELGGLELTAASTAMVGLAGGVDYLFRYPYGCLEQKLSRILPMILSGDLVDAFGLPGLAGADYHQVVTETLKELVTFQMSTGSFSFWPGGDHTHPYASAYAVYALVQASRHGYAVDEDMLRNGLKYLSDLLHGEYDREWSTWPKRSWLSTKALALYTLALAGKPEVAYVERLFEEHEYMPLFAKAFLLKTIPLSETDDSLRLELVREFNNMIRVSPTQAHFEEPESAGLWWCWSSDTRTTAIVLQALLEIEGRHPLAARMVRWLLRMRRHGHWSNTQENLYVLYALTTYYRIYERQEPDFRAEIELAGRKVFDQVFQGRELSAENREFGFGELPPGKSYPVGVQKKGTGRLYYLLRMSYYPRQFDRPRDQGMAVFKSITSLDSSVAAGSTYPAGVLLKVTLRVVTAQQRSYVVLEDPLPAGLEAVNLSLATESRERARQLRAIRRQSSTPWWVGFRHSEMYDDRVLFFADWLDAGVHEITYLARTTTTGRFTMPPTQVEEMYTPEVFGRSDYREIAVR